MKKLLLTLLFSAIAVIAIVAISTYNQTTSTLVVPSDEATQEQYADTADETADTLPAEDLPDDPVISDAEEALVQDTASEDSEDAISADEPQEKETDPDTTAEQGEEDTATSTDMDAVSDITTDTDISNDEIEAEATATPNEGK